MPRYVKQPHDSTCAAIAIINAGKWLKSGHTLTFDYPLLRKKMNLFNGNRPSDGLIDKQIRSELKYFASIRRVQRPLKFEIESKIKQGYAALVAYSYWSKEEKVYESHIAFFSEVDENRNWLGHNAIGDYASCWVKDAKMHEYFYKGYELPVIWLLKRK